MNSVRQDILPLSPSSLPIHRYSRRLAGHAARALSESDERSFGIAISQTNDGTIDHIAIATQNAVYLIDTAPENFRRDGTLDKTFFDFLASTKTILGGFGMPRIALRLHHHIHSHVRGVDLSTILSRDDAAWRPSKVVSKICLLKETFPVDRLWHENDQDKSSEQLCLRAWISAKVACAEETCSRIQTVRKVDTRSIRKDILLCLGTLLRQNDILARAHPKVSNNEYESAPVDTEGNMKLVNARYKTRVRVSKQSYVEAVSTNGKIFRGQAKGAKGKTTHIHFQQGISTSHAIQSVRVIGLDEPTTSEKARDSLLLRVLQDEAKLTDAEFVRFIWFKTEEDTRRLQQPSVSLHINGSLLEPHLKHLNASQVGVVAAMVNVNLNPVVVVHGPPGTGKTTTISSAAEIWSKVYSEPVWIIGHSNVSVKNIAEKLLKRKVDFKLIVSKEFYVEWHEHIYETIQERLMRTDELPADRLAMSRVVGSSRVILSTLGLLSNPALDKNGTFDIIPVERLIVDEASQINVFEYMHVFHKFRKSLQKVCFFGDPKQLPPFGQEKAKTLQSIFEIKHLRAISYFLDTQYRMPVPLGNFISAHVYKQRLKSQHDITDYSCVRFVNTPRGVEEKRGTSWVNSEEVSTIVHLVRHYYHSKKFCIITPYDPQRSFIQKRLKQEDLPWEDVFNVDSFQGKTFCSL
ncbi:P-loop containing nucleoside triphosphate hydrolase protein [Gymnopus androsaceus JB14]|uniref:P-loop containing nucleoside triphosphate hydrolase protein n=1 Tax=Gymnopus androsaceus JB14 TaxID=1447944 RepID=A0A6A4HKW5_9AGAR|nr:P-loop containing nucleoside triphosphate hydrolase protein [Gymnopus androsaceus JB14]